MRLLDSYIKEKKQDLVGEQGCEGALIAFLVEFFLMESLWRKYVCFEFLSLYCEWCVLDSYLNNLHILNC